MAKIIGNPLPNIPWQDKPAGYDMPIWRYQNNPIISRHQKPGANSIFNSAVVPFKDGFAGVFRCDSRGVSMDIYPGFSKDGYNWEIRTEPVQFVGDVPNVTFPCAALADAETGRIAIYYGCADTVTGLCFTTVDELLEYTKKNSL